MRDKTTRRINGKHIAAAVAALAPVTAQAAAPLTLDLRLNPASQQGFGTKVVANFSPNQVFTLDLYAILANGDNNRTNDGFHRTHGSFTSSNGGLAGTFRGDGGTNPNTQTNNVTPFKGATALSGRTSDLDGDGDLDVGSYVTSGTVSPFPWFESISDTNTSPQLGSGTSGNQQFVIGQILFTVAGSSGTTSLNYVPRLRTDGGVTGPRVHWFRIDGFDYLVDGNGVGVKGGSTAVSGALAVGDPVIFAVPEPAGLGVLAISAITLIRRRRK